MRHRKTENTMALLGGALLGATAMYLLDPETGRRRRERLAETTGDALGRAGEAIGPAWESISERARDLTGRLGEGVSSFGSAASERVSDARDSGSSMLSGWGEALGSLGRRFTRGARGYGGDVASSARDYRDSAWESARDYAARARGMPPWGSRDESHTGAYAAAGLSAAALGAAAIYFFDPASGRTRRKMLADQATRIVNDTGRCMRQTGRYVQDMLNRGRGLAHETRSRFSNTQVGDVPPETLRQRIRSQMGHVLANAGAVDVAVNEAGEVTLTGSVGPTELDTLLSTVNRVPGVCQIINRLDVVDSPEAFSGGSMGTVAGRGL